MGHYTVKQAQRLINRQFANVVSSNYGKASPDRKLAMLPATMLAKVEGHTQRTAGM